LSNCWNSGATDKDFWEKRIYIPLEKAYLAGPHDSPG